MSDSITQAHTDARALFEQLESAVVPLMKEFQEDLIFDKTWIVERPGRPFVHFTQSRGTHILGLPDKLAAPEKTARPLLSTPATSEEIYDWMIEVMGFRFLHRVLICHVFDGERLRVCSGHEGMTAYCSAMFDAQNRSVLSL